ncbi:MAG: hypothetical protein JJE09_02425 [Bacteroidia bacterium]|nr:hypothetical protein [Bacteroidia bacterium]
MKQILIAISISALLLGFGCTQKEKLSDQHHHDEQAKVEQAEEHAKPEFAPVQLDNGKKWIANAETSDGIQNMLALLETPSANPTSDSKVLKEKMMSEFTGILKKCTMKGESHTQLHNFLLPLKDKLEKMEAGKKQDLEEINFYLNTYKNYFE